MADFFRFRILAWFLFWMVIAIVFMLIGMFWDSDFLIGFLLIIFILGSHGIWVFGDQDEFYTKPKRSENDEYFEAMRND